MTALNEAQHSALRGTFEFLQQESKGFTKSSRIALGGDVALLISRPSVKALFGSWVQEALEKRYAALDVKEAEAMLEREKPKLDVIYGNPPLLCFEIAKRPPQAA